MHEPATDAELRQHLDQWRRSLTRGGVVSDADLDELEDHLWATVDTLAAAGLSRDEAFLVAVRRLGTTHALSGEFAREHSDRLWKQLVVGEPEPSARPWDRAGVWPMLGFAVLAGLAVRIPVGVGMDSGGAAVGVLLGWAVLGLAAVVGAYLSWLRRPPSPGAAGLVGAVLVVLAVANAAFPFRSASQTQPLFLMHAAISLAVVLGAAYLASGWRSVDRWLDWVRFLGELIVYYVLIALAGGALVAIAMFSFSVVGVPGASEAVGEWVLPLGMGGAVIVAAWLVEAKKSVVENMAPVLTAVFTPLVTLLLIALLGAMVATGQLADVDRNLLIAIDLLLVVVWGLVLFSVSARPPDAAPRLFDWLQWVCVLVVLAVNVVALTAMAGRIGEFGASANKLAALGENVVLALNLAWSAWLSWGFLRGRRPAASLARWQAGFLPVIGAWALIVALVFPLAFGFA